MRAFRAAFAARATFRTLLLFIAITRCRGMSLSLLLIAVVLIIVVRTFLVLAIFLIVATTLSHFLCADRATGSRLQVHVRGELLENRGTKHGKELVNLREDNDAQNHCNE